MTENCAVLASMAEGDEILYVSGNVQLTSPSVETLAVYATELATTIHLIMLRRSPTKADGTDFFSYFIKRTKASLLFCVENAPGRLYFEVRKVKFLFTE